MGQCAWMFIDMGFQLYATKHTQEILVKEGGIDSCITLFKPMVKREPNVLTLLQAGKLDLVINVPDSMDSQAATEGFEIRRAAIDSSTPLIADIKTAILTTMSLHQKWMREKEGRPFWTYNSW